MGGPGAVVDEGVGASVGAVLIDIISACEHDPHPECHVLSAISWIYHLPSTGVYCFVGSAPCLGAHEARKRENGIAQPELCIDLR